MPWTVKKIDNKFCVVPEGEDSPIKGGCHSEESQADAHMKALYSAEEVYNLLESFEDGYDVEDDDLLVASGDFEEFAWEGPIAFENVLTGDNRIFKPDSINWDADTLPWSFRWQKASGQGHAGSVQVGRVDKIERKDDGVIYGYGVVIPAISDEAAEYLRILECGAAGGCSVDGDSAQFDVIEMAEGQPRYEFNSMRLRALSAVDIPAFNGARIHLIKDETSEVETLPESSVKEDTEPVILATDDTEVVDTNSSEDGEFTESTVTVEAETVTENIDLTDETDHGWNFNDLVASAIPVKPPTEWFQDPIFDGPTPLTVTKEGQVSGYLALFNTCHIAFPGTCVRPPKGSKYQYFHTGEIETMEGDLVSVGRLTFNTGHANMQANPKVAAEHYDNTGTVAADVRAGEDEHGIWVVGALRSHLSDEDIRTFRAAPLSGDWRRIAGRLELVGALSVNIPGFPVPRVRALVASGETETLFTFLEDDNSNFESEELDLIPDEYEQSLRLDKKVSLALRMGVSLQDEEIVPTTKLPDDEVPDPPTDEEIKAIAKSLTKEQLLHYLQDIRDLLDDEDEIIPKKTRANLELMYSYFIKTDENGKKTEASGMDVEEFYNHCHGEGGKFCETPGGVSGEANRSRGGRYQGGRPRGGYQGGNQGNQQGRRRGGNQQGQQQNKDKAAVNHYQKMQQAKKNAFRWVAASVIAYGLLVSSAVQGALLPVISGVLPIAAVPAVSALLVPIGLWQARANFKKAKNYKKDFDRQIDRIAADQKSAKEIEASKQRAKDA